MKTAPPHTPHSDLEVVGLEMHQLAAELYPLHRSLTGDGLRRTLDVLGRELPLERHEVPTGTRAFEWEVPAEWTLREAWIADHEGSRIIDVADSNLHVVAYSRGIRQRMPWRDLAPQCHSLPDRPNVTPYRTAYFSDRWGFCLPHALKEELDREPDLSYQVTIDATLAPGAMSYGEVVLPGRESGTVLVWAHACHPSLANDNLSGIAVAWRLARWLQDRPRRYTWRFLFGPATLGSIVWLAHNRDRLAGVEAGIVLAGVGDAGSTTYKRSRRGTALVDRAAAHALAGRGIEHEIRDFDPLGYDERQFCSPGFDLPVGCLMRTPPDEYPEYHTSADDLSFLSPRSLGDSWSTCVEMAEILEHDRVYASTSPHGEPRLGSRNLYVAHGDPAHRAAEQRAILWTLNLADGRHSLLDTAERAGLPFSAVRRAADRLIEHALLGAAEPAGLVAANLPADDASPFVGSSTPPPPAGCLACGKPLARLVVDLGTSPLCESYVPRERFWQAEPVYPLRVYLCDACLLVQVPPLVGGEEIFRHYAYFSSYSTSWVDHARELAETAIERFGLGPSSLAVEVASNDGYLLQHFVARGIPVLGIEPAANVAEAARARGVPTRVEFFHREGARRLAAEGVRADLVVAINVIGHVPALNEFVGGFPVILSDAGVLVVEIPSFLATMRGNQFDQIYQEHYCYYTFHTLKAVLESQALVVFDVEELATHGGSLRVYARRADGEARPVSPAVEELLARERAEGALDADTYEAFAERVAETKRRLLEFLIGAKREGKRIAGYGAPGKGNTLLNYCGIREDFLDYTVDRNPFKQGTFLPGTRIPVHPPERIAETRPDYVLLLPWNLADELVGQLAYVRAWGGRLVVPIPEPRVIE